jgi:gliding motility-associated-like protein
MQKIKFYIVVLLCFFGKKNLAQLPMPDSVCMGTTRIYRVNDATVPSTYTWRINGIVQSSNSNSINVNWLISGTYIISVIEHPNPIANAGNDGVVCLGSPMQLNGSGGVNNSWSPSTYLDNPNSSNPNIINPPVGILKYSLQVKNAFGCSSSNADTVSITVAGAAKLFAGNDTAIAVNQALQLNAIDVNNSGFTNYTWSPSFGLNNGAIKNPIAQYNAVGTYNYSVSATSTLGCVATDKISIRVFIKSDIFVPTIFTPNGDGINDRLMITPVAIKSMDYFIIYDRFGKAIFRTSDMNTSWDGRVNGVNADFATYVWQVKVIDYLGSVIYKKGTVVLAR